MATSVLSSIFNLVDSKSINNIASRLGEPGWAVSRGLESSTAALVNSLAKRTNDPTSMSQIFRLISQAPSDVNVSDLASAVTGPGQKSSATASLLDSGKKFLSQTFGGDESSILDAIGRSAGLRMTSISSLVSLAAPLLMSELGRMVRSEQMTQGQFGNWLVKESGEVQSLLPEALQKPRLDEASRPLSITTLPELRPRSLSWLWILPALLLIPLLIWLFNREHLRQVSQAGQGAVERVRIGATDLGNFIIRKLPNNVDLHVPLRGVEVRLLDFIQDPSKNADEITWFDFDRLLFDTDSAKLRPESQEQLRNIAAILIAYPNVHIKIGGYTDNTGDPQHNLKLSQDRADGVVTELVALGISPDRLEAQGYGDQYPVADNSTEEGRAKNRRISMRVTQK